MKAFATIGIGSLGSISFRHDISASSADRPYGIPADAWIRLDESLGIVITSRSTAASGYFMVRQANVWQRLSLDVPRSSTTASGGEAEPQS